MIEQTSFLGMPLRTQRQRRLLVVLYYAAICLLGGLALWRSHGTIPMYLIPQVLIVGGMLGGIKVGGPVKMYAESLVPIPNGVQTLNLAGRRSFSETPGSSPLDEREQTRRDRAHYMAYSILRWTLGLACCVYWLSLNWSYAWLSTKGPILAWILLVYVLSLPQSVLLWTEPEEPAGELAALPRP